MSDLRRKPTFSQPHGTVKKPITKIRCAGCGTGVHVDNRQKKHEVYE